MVQDYPVICLMGPTASGKSRVALAIAQQWPVEIVNVDATLIYKGLNIGSAKPSEQELKQVPHHLVDIRYPDHPYSVADFVKDASACIDLIQQRGKYPLLVGGTMMYCRALQYGLSNLPQADPQLRDNIEQQAQQQGWPALHDLLAQVDLATAERIHPNDAQRIQRALEVYYLTGQPLSEHNKQNQTAHPGPFINIGLLPDNRAWLHDKIEKRFQKLLECGFIEEVSNLVFQQGYSPELPALRSVGYRQIIHYLQGYYDYDTMIHKAIVATRQLAKRQITWLRKWPNLHPICCDQTDLADKLEKHLTNQLR